MHFNDIGTVEKMLQQWNVGSKKLNGKSKGCYSLKINEKEKKLRKCLKPISQTIRSLLAIQMDDYRLLSLESVALHNRNRITKEWNYGYDRLRYLSNKYCDANKEFDRAVVSVKRFRIF